jgi:hypothetical protein
LVKKYSKAVTLWEESKDAFEDLDMSVDPTLRDLWRIQEEAAMRNQDEDKSAMDIFQAKISKGELK